MNKKTKKKIFDLRIVFRPFLYFKKKVLDFMNRRPHRSFRLTKRRDYVKSFNLPGYLSFTKYVIDTIWINRKKFAPIVFLYALMTLLLVGIASQDVLGTVRDTIDLTGLGVFSEGSGSIEKAGLVFLTAVTGGLNSGLTDVQQLYAGFIVIMTWLSCVWLLRNTIAGHKVSARDAIYSSGSPIVPTMLVSLLLIIQALPIAVAMIGYGAAASTGLLDGGVEAMMFWVAAILLAVLSLYWMTSTAISLVVVTLPGMHPYKAIKIGSDLVVGRRVKILFRFLWMLLLLTIFWIVILIPIILLDGWLQSVWGWYGMFPAVPIAMLILSTFTVVWVSSYVYLFYRKVVADDAASV